MAVNIRSQAILSNLDEYNFHILGCGAIGSSAATQLVRMGATNISLYDMDKVEEPNIGVSQYDARHIGKTKVEALSSILIDINPNISIGRHHGEFSQYCPLTPDKDIVILGFDSMKARLDAITKVCSPRLPKPMFIIDGRMGAEQYQQYVVKNLSQYKKTWYSDSEGDPEPCNAKATSYCSNMSGSFICNTIRKILTNSPYNKELVFNFPTLLLGKKGYDS